MKGILYTIKKWYYYYTRVATVPAEEHLRRDWRQYYQREDRFMIDKEISFDEDESLRKASFYNRAYSFGRSNGENKDSLQGMIWGYVVGYGVVMYFILFKLIIPFFQAINTN